MTPVAVLLLATWVGFLATLGGTLAGWSTGVGCVLVYRAVFYGWRIL